MTNPSEAGTTLLAHQLVAAGDVTAAAAVLTKILHEELGLDVAACVINQDGYSLNSRNGSVTTIDGEQFFFKFHAEEDGDRTADEWYRAGLLADAGYPVELPVGVSTAPGRQVLLYRWCDDERFADACLRVERAGAATADAELTTDARALDATVGRLQVRTLHLASGDEAAAEPIHQLFHHRLVDPDRPNMLGARVARYYVHRSFDFGSVGLDWPAFSTARWHVNGGPLNDTFVTLLERARVLLDPSNPAFQPAVVAHGDAHNANVWRGADGLVLFDPAFAGAHMPALLAEVKATFHNVWAHPFWLYHPSESRTATDATFDDGVLHVDTDWVLTPLRQALLASKADLVWRPLLATLRDRGWLDPRWRAIVRTALFACPTLVMNLRSGPDSSGRDPNTSLLGFTVAMLVGSEGSALDAWFDSIDPGASS